MRYSRIEAERFTEQPLTGSFLVAHPSLRDPHFRQSVVLLTAHSATDGAIGVIINQPIGQTLSELRPEFIGSDFADIPLFRGGPVANEQMILAAWKWCPEDASFKLFFGIDEAKAKEILEQDSGFQLYGFLGHAGWGEDQLEAELDEDAWVVSPLLPEFEQVNGRDLWRNLISLQGPEMQLLMDEPEDPSVN